MPTYQVYYAKNPTFMVAEDDPMPTPESLMQTHALVRSIDASSPEAAFHAMQAERWSPNGEANALILRLGLSHTSMSVGDILLDEQGIYHQCLPFGWRTHGDK
jgi:hypothetical protein